MRRTWRKSHAGRALQGLCDVSKRVPFSGCLGLVFRAKIKHLIASTYQPGATGALRSKPATKGWGAGHQRLAGGHHGCCLPPVLTNARACSPAEPLLDPSLLQRVMEAANLGAVDRRVQELRDTEADIRLQHHNPQADPAVLADLGQARNANLAALGREIGEHPPTCTRHTVLSVFMK
jgi:hypothetical protein